MSDERTQADKFSDAARDLECDLNEEAFDRALGKIAKAPLDEGADDSDQPKNETE